MTLQATVACEVNSYRIPVRFHLPNPDDHIQRFILQNRAFYERAMLEDIGSSLPEDALAVDVGAYIGNHTLFFSSVLGVRTLAIEPNPVAFAVLQANVELNGVNGLVELHPLALGAAAGTGEIVGADATNLGGARFLQADRGDIRMASLDDIVGERRVHLIKVDVNGAEADVLRGAAQTIARCRPKLVVSAGTVAVLAAVEAVLRPLGYRKIQLYNETPTYLFEVSHTEAALPGRAIDLLDPRDLAALPPTREIIAGMATVAGNEIALRATVMSLLPQVDRLYVYLNGFTEAPRFIAEHPKIRHFIDTDGSRYGDAGKFWGLEQVEDAIYVTCDDDIIYPDDFVARMVGELAQLRGQAVVSVHGSIILQPSRGYYKERGRAVFHYERSLMRRRRVHVAATGTGAFHSSVVKMTLADFRHRNMADIWLAEYLHRQGIPAYAVPRKEGWLLSIEVPRSSIYAQSAANTGSTYDSSRRQDEVLSSIYPLSLLASDAADAASIVYLVDTDRADGLVEFILAVAGRERDPIVFVTCDHETEDMRNVTLHPDFLCEVHLVARSGGRTMGYRELLSKHAGRVKAWTLRNGNELKLAAGSEWEKWLEPIAPLAGFISPVSPAAVPTVQGIVDSRPAFDSAKYWEQRYLAGGNSGAGSYNKSAEYKAHILNAFVAEKQLKRVGELGSGDGNQLRYLAFEDYTGFDISQTAVDLCRQMHGNRPGRTFVWLGDPQLDTSSYNGAFELTLSLDVILHLVEDEVYRAYIDRLFSLSNQYVVVYTSNYDAPDRHGAIHVRNRRFTDDVARWLPEWKLLKHVDNPYKHPLISEADFFVFGRDAAEDMSFLDVVNQRPLGQ
ncbi:FkbM family methyltransferase [Rhizobium sp. RCC_161_2]|uniref:FkbM family methyltransferase n=1 Tax=Rhizobium sp. RCC_161_2 TaxID=3239219 RepID=UPI00352394F4